MQNTEFKQQILFISDLEQILGRDRLTIRRWWLIGKFPRPVKLNGTTLAWHIESIEQWIHNNIKQEEAETVI